MATSQAGAANITRGARVAVVAEGAGCRRSAACTAAVARVLDGARVAVAAAAAGRDRRKRTEAYSVAIVDGARVAIVARRWPTQALAVGAHVGLGTRLAVAARARRGGVHTTFGRLAAVQRANVAIQAGRAGIVARAVWQAGGRHLTRNAGKTLADGIATALFWRAPLATRTVGADLTVDAAAKRLVANARTVQVLRARRTGQAVVFAASVRGGAVGVGRALGAQVQGRVANPAAEHAVRVARAAGAGLALLLTAQMAGATVVVD